MKVTVAITALVALAVAAPEKLDKRTVDPGQATASLLQVLPSSIVSVAITNPAAASSLIVEAFSTGTPAWFTSLPGEVQTYFISQVGGASAATTAGPSGPLATGSSSGNATTSTGKYSNSTSSSTGSTTKTSTSSKSSSSGSAASSSSSAGAVPTAVIGGGIAGFVGLVGMLAL